MEILVVDHDVTRRTALARQVAAAGFLPVPVTGGRAALRRLAQPGGSVAAVLTEVLMPEMDGLELLRELRRSHPALAVVATGGRSDLIELDFLGIAAALGADAVLAEPQQAGAALAGLLGPALQPALAA